MVSGEIPRWAAGGLATFLLLLALAMAGIYLPYLFGVSLGQDGIVNNLFDQRTFPYRDVDYSFFTNPVRDFIRSYIDHHHRLPLWTGDAMLGLPLAEQGELQLFNPLEWIYWLGGRGWWAFVICVYLALAGTGISLICRRLLRADALATLTASACYILTGAAMYSVGVHTQLINVLCLPFVIFHTTSLVLFRRHSRRHFIAGTIAIAILMVCGQPQYVAVDALALAVYGLLLCGLFPRRLHRAFYLLVAGGCALLLTAPQNGPLVDALISGRVFAGNHALSGTSSFWHHGFVTASTILAPRIAGTTGFGLWYQPSSPDLDWSPESFQTGYGLITVLLIAAGLCAAFRPARRKRDPLVRLQRLFSALSFAFVAYVVTENLLPRPHSIWPFTFIHLTKYSPPILGVFLILNVPAGFSLLRRLPWPRLALALGLVAVVPLGLFFFIRAQAPISNPPLLAYLAVLTFAGPVIFLGAAISQAGPAGQARGLLPLLLCSGAVLDACIIEVQGIPLPYDYFRLVAFGLLLLGPVMLVAFPGKVGRIFLGAALGGYLAFYLVLSGHSSSFRNDLPAQRSFSRTLAKLQPDAGHLRYLADHDYAGMQADLHFGIKSISNIFPIYPLATQRYYVENFAPDMMGRARLHTWMNFYGPEDSRSGPNSSLTWRTYAEHRLYFDLLGIDVLFGQPQGELAHLADTGALSDLQELEPTGAWRTFRSRSSLGRAFFRSRYVVVPYTNDGSYAQDVMAAEGKSIRTFPVVEAREEQLPKWDSLTSTAWPKATAGADQPPLQPLVISADEDGRTTLHFSAPGAGVLVLNEQYYPGWEVTLNGAEQALFRVNTVSQGVLIPDRGDYQVEFKYAGSLRRDLKISILGLLLMLFASTSLQNPAARRRHLTAAA